MHAYIFTHVMIGHIYYVRPLASLEGDLYIFMYVYMYMNEYKHIAYKHICIYIYV